MTQRKYLAQLIQKYQDIWWLPDEFQNTVRPLLPNTLKVISPPPPAEKNYNCFLYAMKLNNDPQVLEISHGFLQNDLILQMIDSSLLRASAQPSAGDIVIYFDRRIPTHAGILTAKGQVISKWSWGPILRHGLWDVPDFYGNHIEYFAPLSVKRLRRWVIRNIPKNPPGKMIKCAA